MPELPEVETFARRLRGEMPDQPAILGLTIAGMDVLWPKTLATPADGAAQIHGQAVKAVGRRAKFLTLHLSRQDLLIHLRMSGDLQLLTDPLAELPAHTRLLLRFENGWRLAFNDPRKFGRAWLVDDSAEVFGDLGPEPLDESLTASGFHAMLHARDRQMKPLLLDQHFMAGIGNIYSDEALHLAGIHPLRSSAGIQPAEAAALLAAIRSVLQAGIDRNGASIDWVYRGGDFQNHFRVYGRTGQACPVCGEIIVHLQVGQRSTHVCPVCQPLEDHL